MQRLARVLDRAAGAERVHIHRPVAVARDRERGTIAGNVATNVIMNVTENREPAGQLPRRVLEAEKVQFAARDPVRGDDARSLARRIDQLARAHEIGGRVGRGGNAAILERAVSGHGEQGDALAEPLRSSV